MIDVNCYNCDSGDRTHYAAENGFNLVKCSGCGLLYVTPRPEEEEINKAHQHGVHEGESTLSVTGAFEPEKVRRYRKILKDMYQSDLVGKSWTWLDVGCGHGEFLVALQRLGRGHITAKGSEPNVHKQEVARSKGLDVDFFDIADHEHRYDAISLLNVYSHLPNPREFLQLCRSLLRLGGELLLETGDSAHLSPEDMYNPMFLPDHLSFGSEEIASGILVDCGFEIVRVRKYQALPFTWVGTTKELVKVFWPNKVSRIRYTIDPLYRTDMYIRARLLQ